MNLKTRTKFLGVVMTFAYCIGIAGCTPYVTHYYKPVATEGVVLQHDCGGRAGPDTDLRLPRGSDVITVYSKYEPDASADLQLEIEFQLSKNSRISAQFEKMEIRQSDNSSAKYTIENQFAYNAPLTSFNIANARVESIGDMDGGKFGFYDISISISSNLSDQMVFVLPPMTVDGVSYPALEIKYEKSSGAWILPLNC